MGLDLQAKEIIQQAAEQLQNLDERIEELKLTKNEIFADLKAQGLNVKLTKAAITEIRKQLKTSEAEADEKDIYIELIKTKIRDPKDGLE